LDKKAIEGKVLGLYFSAHWCPPCRGFTPQLAEWYKAVIPTRPDFEIVFVSSDRDEASFKEYFAEMPWIALPYVERKRKEQLSNRLGVEGIPSFVIVDKDGTVINANGRSIPSADPKGTEFPWHPKPVRSLEDPEGINETPSLVVLTDKVSEEMRKSISAALGIVAAEYVEKAKKSDDDTVLFFLGGPGDERITEQIRKLTNQPSQDDAVAAVLLDLADEGTFYAATDVDFTKADSIREFVQKFSAKSLPKQTVG